MDSLFAMENKTLGKGSFGTVYLGTDILNDKYVALKSIPATISNDQQKIQALGNEILISSELVGDNLVKLRDITEIDNKKYLVYDYCNGGDLRLYLKHFGKFDEDLVQNIIRQVLTGLNELHNKKITHHDIKPENLLVSFIDKNELKQGTNEEKMKHRQKFDEYIDKVKKFAAKQPNQNSYDNMEDGEINDKILLDMLRECKFKVSDFGLSKFNEENNEKLLSGSPLYMSPEMFTKDVPINIIESPKVDLWAVGVLAYECFFGRRPFNSEDGQLTGLIKTLNDGRYKLDIMRCRKISRQFVSFLNVCLQKEQKDRPCAEYLLLSEFVCGEVGSFEYITIENLHQTEIFENKHFSHHYVVPGKDYIYMHTADKKFFAKQSGLDLDLAEQEIKNSN